MPDETAANQPEESQGKAVGGCTGKGFMPGQSGNPGGRPKSKPVTEILEELFDSENKEFIKQQLLQLLGGKSAIAKVLLLEKAAERIEGKVTQTVEINGELNVSISDRMKRAKERREKHNG